jgi:hypothetical protein
LPFRRQAAEPNPSRSCTIPSTDRTILRDLAFRVADIADQPVMQERRERWKRHNRLQPERPLILIFPEGSWGELPPPSVLRCEGQEARHVEWQLRSWIYYHDHFQDDTVIEKIWPVHKTIRETGWGLETRRKASDAQQGAFGFDPVIESAADLKKIRFPEITWDEADTRARLERMQDVFGDIMDVQLKGVAHVSFHLMLQFTGWRGLDRAMMDMVDEPGLIHEAMALLEEGHRGRIRQFQDLNLLSLNNDGTYQSTGGNGYTEELPAEDFDPEHIRPCDLCASAEAQELAVVSPDMHREFAMDYEMRLLEPFGLTGYGCCEDLSRKLHHVKEIPHIRRISISPFADVALAAEQLRDGYILSWKPKPQHLVGTFDEDLVRTYLTRGLEQALAHDCVLEIILKDTHTCEHHPERFDAWSRIAREVVEAGVAV